MLIASARGFTCAYLNRFGVLKVYINSFLISVFIYLNFLNKQGYKGGLNTTGSRSLRWPKEGKCKLILVLCHLPESVCTYVLSSHINYVLNNIPICSVCAVKYQQTHFHAFNSSIWAIAALKLTLFIYFFIKLVIKWLGLYHLHFIYINPDLGYIWL